MRNGIYKIKDNKMVRVADNSGQYSEPKWQQEYADITNSTIFLREAGVTTICAFPEKKSVGNPIVPTWDAIRTSSVPQGDGVASYDSWYPNGDGPDVYCDVQIHIEGSDETGYILVTVDDADGPRDDAGRTVYSTDAAAQLAALTFARGKQ